VGPGCKGFEYVGDRSVDDSLGEALSGGGRQKDSGAPVPEGQPQAVDGGRSDDGFVVERDGAKSGPGVEQVVVVDAR